MKKGLSFLGGLIFLGAVSQESFAEPASAATVAARDRHKKIFSDKTLYSEKHRNKQANSRLTSKYPSKKMSQTSWEAHSKISRVIISGNKTMASADIKNIITPYLQDGVTQKELKIISGNIEKFYNKKGYYLPIAHAEINNSVLKIRIIEGKIRNVLVELRDKEKDKKVLENKLLLGLIDKIVGSNPLKTKKLERYLLLIKKIHGYDITYNLIPLENIQGNEVADLLLEISTSRGEAQLSVDNKGVSELGKYQFDISSQIFNPFENDSLTLSAGTSNKPKRYQIIAGGYLKRLNSYGTSASIFAAYSKDKENVSSSGSHNSRNTVIKGRIDQYVLLNNDNSVKLELGIERRDIKEYSQSVKTKGYKYSMGSIGGKIKITDPLNTENWFFPYFNGVLNRVSYSASSTEARNFDKDFNYFIVDWYRDQALPKDFSLFLKASYQVTDKLLPTEHLYSVGTHHTGRGYKIGLVYADQGASASAELRYIKRFNSDKIRKFLGAGQIFGFFDVTHFIKHNKDSNRSQHSNSVYFDKSTLPALGLGLRLYFQHEVYAEGTAEFPTVKNIKIDGVKHNNRPIYRFLLSKEFNW